MPVAEISAMTSNEGLIARRSSPRVPLLTEKLPVTTILLLFLLLHGLAVAMLKSTMPLIPRPPSGTRETWRCGCTTDRTERGPDRARAESAARDPAWLT